jgi:2-keto-3-deoxy-L-rhamnonate aldolase RhmA
MISIREQLRQNKALVGTMIRICRDPAVMQVLRGEEMDMMLIGMEHSSLNISQVSDLV